MKTKPTPTYKIAGIIWGVSVVVFGVLIAIKTNLFKIPLKELDFASDRNFILAVSFTVLLSIFSFASAILDIMNYIFDQSGLYNSNPGIRARLGNSVIFFLFILLFPLFLAFIIFNPLTFFVQVYKRRRQAFNTFAIETFLGKTIQILLVLGLLLPLWIGGYFAIGAFTYQTVKHRIGYYEDAIPIAGTGSMYPTFPKGKEVSPILQRKEIVAKPSMMPYPNGIVILGKRYFNTELGRFDIVDFENEKTFTILGSEPGEYSGFAKRIIGLPNDTVEIRGGLVYVNDEPLKEPYTAQARSTFGGTFIPDCQKITVPKGKLLVLGDNRKGSLDSRYELEFISYSDVNHYIPYDRQIGVLDTHWRDTTNDLSDSAKITLNRETYLTFLNEKRKEEKLPPLKYQPKLQLSAEKRAAAILKYNDFSYEAEKSGYTMEKAMRDAGYSNIVYGEAPLQGFYEADELIENEFEFPNLRKFLLNKDYQEIGIAEVEGQINGCPTQVIVQQVAGYVPPNYKKEDIQSWREGLSKLKEIQTGWRELTTYQDFYAENKVDVDRINELIQLRIDHLGAIVSRMEKNQWLTNQEESYITQEKSLSDEQNQLASRLNEKLQ